MQQKYIYSFNSTLNWLRGVFFPVLDFNARLVYPAKHLGKTFVWRNHFTQSYKVTDLSQPLDLSTLLFIRTRERLLLANKVLAPRTVMKKGTHNKATLQVAVKSLESVDTEINEQVQ